MSANIDTASDVESLVAQCHGAAYDAGWWHSQDLYDVNYRDAVRGESRFGKALIAEKIALIHSEVSEALEGVRKGKADEHLPEFTAVEVELADALIRIFDLAGAMELRLGLALVTKLSYNAVRADHKPEARAAVGGKAF